jgi:hypothetical protein
LIEKIKNGDADCKSASATTGAGADLQSAPINW